MIRMNNSQTAITGDTWLSTSIFLRKLSSPQVGSYS
jgi:hypothetical protein